MNLYVGVVALAVAATLFAWGYEQHRRPVPAAWTRYDALSVAFMLLIICLVAPASGALVMVVAHPVATLASLSVTGLVITAAVTIAAWLLSTALVRRARPPADTPVVPFPKRPAQGTQRFRRAA